MPVTETDYAYLFQTLSEARARATEISQAVHSRVGAGHRLSELGNSAVAQIENLLRQIRRVAADAPGGLPEQIPTFSQPETKRPAAPPERVNPSTGAVGPASPQHWFPGFVNDLLEQFEVSGEISFEAVERALSKRKEAFLKDLEVTRRMYRTYPQLFQDLETRSGQGA